MFTLSYWFDAYPGFFTPIFLWIFLGIFTAAVLFGVICLRIFVKKKLDKIYRVFWVKLRNWGFFLGIVGLILVFFKSQRTPYLGMRIWLVIWLLICLVWLGFIIKYLVFTVPKVKKEALTKKEFEKYLP